MVWTKLLSLLLMVRVRMTGLWWVTRFGGVVNSACSMRKIFSIFSRRDGLCSSVLVICACHSEAVGVA